MTRHFSKLMFIILAPLLSACAQNTQPEAPEGPTASSAGAATATTEIADLRLEMVQHIVNFEARRDSQGKILVYRLPAGDGGGSYEVAGINDRYHPEAAARLAAMIEDGEPEKAEAEAVLYIAGKTDFPAREARTNAIKFLLRDIAWNRGPTGAVRTLQIALGVDVDGRVGPDTRGALLRAEDDPKALISSIRAAREIYERRLGRDESSIFWAGLVNRWNKAGARAESYL